jgi:hypothetical protein
MRADTQKSDLLALLGREWVTPQSALLAVGCMSLAQRVSEWRRLGYEFNQRVMVSGRSRFAAYRLAKKPKG